MIKLGRPKTITPKICAGCGIQFQPERSASKYHDAECSTKAQSARFKVARDLIRARDLPKSAPEARKLNSSHYQGPRCKNGHEGIRKTKTNECIDCRVDHLRRDCKKRSQGRVRRVKKEPVFKPVASLQTVSTWLHILPNWQPVVVRV